MVVMMKTITLTNLAEDLKSLVEQAHAGQTFILTREGQPVAVLLGINGYERLVTLDRHKEAEETLNRFVQAVRETRAEYQVNQVETFDLLSFQNLIEVVQALPKELAADLVDFINFWHNSEEEDAFAWAKIQEAMAYRKEHPEDYEVVTAEEWLKLTADLRDNGE